MPNKKTKIVWLSLIAGKKRFVTARLRCPQCFRKISSIGKKKGTNGRHKRYLFPLFSCFQQAWNELWATGKLTALVLLRSNMHYACPIQRLPRIILLSKPHPVKKQDKFQKVTRSIYPSFSYSIINLEDQRYFRYFWPDKLFGHFPCFNKLSILLYDWTPCECKLCD